MCYNKRLVIHHSSGTGEPINLIYCKNKLSRNNTKTGYHGYVKYWKCQEVNFYLLWPEKVRQLVGRSRNVGKLAKESGKSREFHSGKDLGILLHNLFKQEGYFGLFSASEHILHKISCKIGREYEKQISIKQEICVQSIQNIDNEHKEFKILYFFMKQITHLISWK